MSELPFSDLTDAAPITVEAKWQGAVNEKSGFVALPISLLRLQKQLKLNATDMVVLTNLLAHWWKPNEGVFPRTTTIANRMGVDKRTIQRSTQKLVRAGLMERTKLADGKRAFRFDSLAAQLARRMPQTLEIAGKESFDA
jgi:predicted transcriptional regulator